MNTNIKNIDAPEGLGASTMLTVQDLSKSFGVVKALKKCSLDIHHGEILGIVGHNGAGKSTLVNILVGLLSADDGVVAISGHPIEQNYNSSASYLAGIRCVFQELSLCNNLDVVENTLLAHAALGGFQWRKEVSARIGETLDDMFPGHKISLNVPIGAMSIGQRQMIEIARAFISTKNLSPSLVILDEPTSSLDANAAGQLMEYLRRVKKSRGISSVLISHKLGEVIENSDRIVVMRDGGVIAHRVTDEINKEDIISLMGGASLHAATAAISEAKIGEPRVSLSLERPDGKPFEFVVHAGELVGLAGLDGHGQKAALRQIFQAFQERHEKTAKVVGDVAYVAGDRQREGVFPLWSIGANIGVSNIRKLGRGFINARREKEDNAHWFDEIGVRSPSPDMNILTLSGGNQQKALIARSFASGAGTILLDDPTRGVDLQTKQEIYKRVRSAAHDDGKCAIWYSTEAEEFFHCDRVYVFHNGKITDMIPRHELSEERLVRSSFEMNANL